MAAVVVAAVIANPNLQRQRHPRPNLPRVTTFVQMGMSVQVMIMIAITLAVAVAILAVPTNRMPLKKSLWLQAFSREHLKCVPTQDLLLAIPARQMEEDITMPRETRIMVTLEALARQMAEDITIVRVASLMDTLEALARQMEEGITIIVREASPMVTLAAVVDIPAHQMVDITMATTLMYIPARRMEEDITIVREASLMDTIVREASLMVTLEAVVDIPARQMVDITMATTLMHILAALVAVVTILTTFTGQPSLQKPRLQKCFDRMVTSLLSTVMMVTSA